MENTTGKLLTFPGIPRANVTPAPTARPGVGAKYQKGRTIAEIKRLLVADIKAAIKAGQLPQGTYKVSARQGRGTGHDRIEVAIAGLAIVSAMNPARRQWMVEHGGRDDGFFGYRLSDEAREVVRTVQAMVDAYGYDRSDSMTDYFDFAFSSSVDVDIRREYELAEQAGRQRAAERRA